jgi:hypothetical protein
VITRLTLPLKGVAASLCAVTLLLAPSEGFAARWSLYDFDGTLMMDRTSHDNDGNEILPAWVTYHEFYLVAPSLAGQTNFDRLRNEGALPERLFLSRDEKDQLIKRFAKEDGKTGNVEPVDLRSDPVHEAAVKAYRRYGFTRENGMTIYPGYYAWSTQGDNTFRFHREGEPFAKPPILTDLELGIARDQAQTEKIYRLLGKAFKYLIQGLLNHQDGDRHFVITDRVVTAETGFKILKLLKKHGYIPQEIPDALLRQVEWLSMNDLMNRTMYGRRKAEVIKQKMFELNRASSGSYPTHDVISTRLAEAQTGVTFTGHESVIYENDPRSIEELLREVGGELGFYNKLKLMVYHAGRPEEVRSSLINRGNPSPENLQRFAVLQPDIGTFRHLLENERQLLRPLKCTEKLNGLARHLED